MEKINNVLRSIGQEINPQEKYIIYEKVINKIIIFVEKRCEKYMVKHASYI